MNSVVKRCLEAVAAAVTSYIVLTLLAAAARQVINLPQQTATTQPASQLTPEVKEWIIKGLLSLMIALFWYLVRNGAAPGATGDAPQLPPVDAVSPPPPDNANAGLMQALQSLQAMTRRKDEYKEAYFRTGKALERLKLALVASGTASMPGLEADVLSDAGRDNLARRFWRRRSVRYLLTTSLLVGVAYFATGRLQTAAYASLGQGLQSSSVPKWILFFQTFLMLACLPFITGAMYWKTRAQLTLRQNASDAISMGFVAVVVAGLFFFLQLSPEDLRILHDVQSGPLPLIASYQPSLWEWRFVQRLILFPLVGLVGPVVVMFVRAI